MNRSRRVLDVLDRAQSDVDAVSAIRRDVVDLEIYRRENPSKDRITESCA